MVLKIDDLPDTGMARMEELRQSVLRLRSAGKKVVAVVLKAEDPEYLLASAADRVYALPQSVFQIDGLRARAEFAGGTMEKLGVSWDVARVGAYKNSPDQLTRSEMSAEQREALTAYLDATYQHLQASIAARVNPEALQRALDAALIPPATARELGLVDEVISPQDLDQKLHELLPGARFEASYAPFSRRDAAWGRRKAVAIVPVVGTISGGKSRQDGLTGSAIAGAETVIRALAEAAEDDQVAAIVIRVDSPGGDGLASDLMYRAVLDAAQKKPVVASMGDRAASGGYYAAMGAQQIYASPATLTGSIGVFYLKPALGDLLGKLGITSQVITRGPHADFSSELRPWTPRRSRSPSAGWTPSTTASSPRWRRAARPPRSAWTRWRAGASGPAPTPGRAGWWTSSAACTTPSPTRAPAPASPRGSRWTWWSTAARTRRWRPSAARRASSSRRPPPSSPWSPGRPRSRSPGWGSTWARRPRCSWAAGCWRWTRSR